MRIKTIVSYDMGENCYIVIDENSNEAIIIDPGNSADRIIEFIKSESIKPKAIFLTHGHFDHIDGCERVRKEFNIEVIAHENEKEILENKIYNLSVRFSEPYEIKADKYFKDNEEYEFNDMKIKVIHTPGHTEGGCCYYFINEKVLFSGDTLFYYSTGRTDFPSGSAEKLVKSIHRLFNELDDDVHILPGHGGHTEIGFEKINNPYTNLLDTEIDS